MNAKEPLDAGRLSAAISELTQEVKRHPSDYRLRTFLFEVLCFAGEYERADRQLDVIGHQRESAGIGIEIYRSLIRAETARLRLYQDALRPSFLLEPPSYIQLHLDALHCLRENNHAGATSLLQRAENMRPPIAGRLAGQPFTSFRESDDLLAPVFEVFAKGVYTWLPFEQIRKVAIRQPRYLRDLLWIPATIEAVEGTVGEVFLPVLYHGSADSEDERIRLGRMTDWRALGDGPTRGIGQHTFVIDDCEKAMLDMRDLEFDVPSLTA